MVICVVVGCSKRSGRDHNMSFNWIPAVVRHTDKQDSELSTRRRDGYLAAISRDDLDVINQGKYRICSRHFISGQPAKLFDCTNPDWLPTINLGHSKWEKQKPCSARYERAQKRDDQQKLRENAVERLSDTVLQEITKAVVTEEVLEVEKEFALVEKFVEIVVNELLSEVVNDDVCQAAREEMEVEIWRYSEFRVLQVFTSNCCIT